MSRDEHQQSPATTARAYRFWLAFAYVLATIFAIIILSILVAGIITQRGILIFEGLFMSVSFALFWREVGSLICRKLRRRRDRALRSTPKPKE